MISFPLFTYIFQYPQITEMVLDRCLKQVRTHTTCTDNLFTSWLKDSVYFCHLDSEIGVTILPVLFVQRTYVATSYELIIVSRRR
jgi:hypothetical protein